MSADRPCRHPLPALAMITLLVGAGQLRAQAAAAASGGDIDAQVWSVISTTVVNHDIDGMAATYHPEAVVVTPQGTMPVARALAGWGKGMETMKGNGSRATVAFRFSKRQDGGETAFESGLFNYAVTDSGGATTRYIIPFEALLVKQGQKWLILMERQLPAADEAAWNAMAQEGRP